ncbi:ATP-binding protein [Hymenobacter sp. DG25B]|nr:ATP-binding protein [Hymenobacter sp. DG25B]
MEWHGGHIWLQSRQQEGTTFIIELPWPAFFHVAT